MYDAFSDEYDRFVNWPNRLDYEMPFLTAQIPCEGTGTRVLDAACGTGMHAIALARLGCAVAGADFSAGMIARAVTNARIAGTAVEFAQAGFGGLRGAFGQSPSFPFDAVMCLGNSLPHLLNQADLQAALVDFAACLRPGGRLVLQNRNFDAVLAHQERWMDPQAYHVAEREGVFVRFYDYLPDGLIQFNILTLRRAEPSAAWQQEVVSTRLYPLRQGELNEALQQAGFGAIRAYGDMQGAPFDAQTSGNLIITAMR